MNLDISVLLPVIGALVATVNIITQVIKKATYDKLPTNIVVLLLSIALTMTTFFVYSYFTNMGEIPWYMIVGSLVMGFFVAYAAMFGYDKLKEAILQDWGGRKDE